MKNNNLKNTGLKRLTAAVFALLLCVPLAWAQSQVKVTGSVVDNLGMPMIGVSILEKGTTNGVVTDLDGNYTLQATEGGTLVFSYVGYVTQEHAVKAGTLNVTLQEDSETLDELVVVGYGVQKKSDVTGSISKLTSDDMKARSITRPEQALQGKTSGIQIINSSAAPGSDPVIRVRGYSSNYSSDPLYIVDGLRVTTISGIDMGYYEAADIDGANRWQKILHITVPMLSPTVLTLSLLALGRIMNSDFGFFYAIVGDNPRLYSTVDVLDTFIYRNLRQLGDISMSGAASFIQAILSGIILVTANSFARKLDANAALF